MLSKTRKRETACRFVRKHCEALIILALFAIAIATVAFIAPALLHDSVFWSAIASIVTILTLLYLASQSYLMTRSFDFDSQWRTKEKAVELAKFYSSSMIARINYCLAIMGEAGVMARLGAIDPKEMDAFTIDELACLSPRGERLNGGLKSRLARLGTTSSKPVGINFLFMLNVSPIFPPITMIEESFCTESFGRQLMAF